MSTEFNENMRIAKNLGLAFHVFDIADPFYSMEHRLFSFRSRTDYAANSTLYLKLNSTFFRSEMSVESVITASITWLLVNSL